MVARTAIRGDTNRVGYAGEFPFASSSFVSLGGCSTITP